MPNPASTPHCSELWSTTAGQCCASQATTPCCTCNPWPLHQWPWKGPKCMAKSCTSMEQGCFPWCGTPQIVAAALVSRWNVIFFCFKAVTEENDCWRINMLGESAVLPSPLYPCGCFKPLLMMFLNLLDTILTQKLSCETIQWQATSNFSSTPFGSATRGTIPVAMEHLRSRTAKESQGWCKQPGLLINITYNNSSICQ